MNSKIAELKIQFEAEAQKAASTAELEALRVAYLGKKGSITELMKEMKDLSPEERRIKRLELEKPVLEAFWCWLENLEVLKGSALGKAVTYALNQRKHMENYLLDGR